jgi:hypothetical protein
MNNKNTRILNTIAESIVELKNKGMRIAFMPFDSVNNNEKFLFNVNGVDEQGNKTAPEAFLYHDLSVSQMEDIIINAKIDWSNWQKYINAKGDFDYLLKRVKEISEQLTCVDFND